MIEQDRAAAALRMPDFSREDGGAGRFVAALGREISIPQPLDQDLPQRFAGAAQDLVAGGIRRQRLGPQLNAAAVNDSLGTDDDDVLLQIVRFRSRARRAGRHLREPRGSRRYPAARKPLPRPGSRSAAP